MTEPTLFDELDRWVKRGQRAQKAVDEVIADHARTAAIARAGRSLDPAARASLEQAVLDVAATMPEFTADEVWVELQDRREAGWLVTMPHEPAALGPVILALARAGKIVKTGALRRTKLARRHRDLTVWRRA